MYASAFFEWKGDLVMAATATKPRVGFDFGGAYLKLAVTDKKGISQLLVEPLPEGLVRDGEIISAAAMLVFLRALLKKHRVRARECAFILPGKHALLTSMSVPVMDARQIRSSLPFRFQDMIPDQKRKYFYDYALAGLETNAEGEVTGLRLMAAATPRDVLEQYVRFFKKAGLKLRVVAPMECAFSNMIRYYETYDPDAVEGNDYCFLDIGHDATRLHMYKGPLYEASRVIEGGSSLVDAAIARDLNLSLAEARTYKESSQEATRHLSEASTAYQDIALEIKKAINYYNSSNPERAIKRIYCFGGGTRMTPLMDVVEETVGLTLYDVARLLPPAHAATGEANLCATAVGITLQ